MSKRQTTVFVSDGQPVNQKGRIKRKTVTLLVAVLLMAGGAGGLAWLKFGSGPDAQTGGKQAGGSKPAEEQLTLDEQVQLANAGKDYSKSVQLMESQKPQSTEDKLKLALAYSNNKQYKESLAIFDELDKAGKLNSSYESAAAETAVAAGDKEAAIRYYQAAKKKAIEEKLVTADSQVEIYDFKITQLQEGKL